MDINSFNLLLVNVVLIIININNYIKLINIDKLSHPKNKRIYQYFIWSLFFFIEL